MYYIHGSVVVPLPKIVCHTLCNFGHKVEGLYKVNTHILDQGLLDDFLYSCCHQYSESKTEFQGDRHLSHEQGKSICYHSVNSH